MHKDRNELCKSCTTFYRSDCYLEFADNERIKSVKEDSERRGPQPLRDLDGRLNICPNLERLYEDRITTSGQPVFEDENLKNKLDRIRQIQKNSSKR